MYIDFLKFSYKYMEYEKELQLREINKFINNYTVLLNSKDKISVLCDNIDEEKLKELTYFYAYEINGIRYETRQGQYERDDTLLVKKQHTRYSTHGIHEYKGKFNPQIVHAIMNIFEINKENKVLDPFNGSGTTILECAHAGVKACGTDINPMACYIANSKVSSLQLDVNNARRFLNELIIALKENKPLCRINDDDERIEYLKKWIPSSTLITLENLRMLVSEQNNPILTKFLLVVASDLIRDYSLQEPSDLRIRRRTTPFPDSPFLEAYNANVSKYLRKIEEVQSFVRKDAFPNNFAVNCDIKKTIPFKEIEFDAAITSPPYVTALPYIDTQRISLVWLGLCTASHIRELETKLIGSREMLTNEKQLWRDAILYNTKELPEEIYTLVVKMKKSLIDKDGFRKQAVPTLVYRYFSGMKDMFLNVKKMIKNNGTYGLVVGYNKTTLGDIVFNINTPELLSVLAESCGWKTEEILPLQTYKRYGINCKNAINRESLIILRSNSQC